MRYKYVLDDRGKPKRAAVIYTREEHGIRLEDIDPDALFVCRKLRGAGHEAYIVGGAIRDLLLGKKPKDFDVVSSAHPRQIKKVLPRSRIIGKRFRLVHVICPGDKIIEVATFRSNKTEDANVFGTLEEDVQRRDFSCNALYYDPKDETILDYVDGVADIRRRRLRPLIPLQRLFTEDPVRMIRAVKYAVMGSLRIGWALGWRIRAEARLLESISPSRLTEEFYKILFSGRSLDLFLKLNEYKVLGAFVPNLDRGLARVRPQLARLLPILDQAVRDGAIEKTQGRAEAFAFLLEAVMTGLGQKERAARERFDEQIDWIKDFFRPIIPSNKECDAGLRALYKSWGVKAPKPRLPTVPASKAPEPRSETPPATKKRRRPRRRRKKSSSAAPTPT